MEQYAPALSGLELWKGMPCAIDIIGAEKGVQFEIRLMLAMSKAAWAKSAGV